MLKQVLKHNLQKYITYNNIIEITQFLNHFSSKHSNKLLLISLIYWQCRHAQVHLRHPQKTINFGEDHLFFQTDIMLRYPGTQSTPMSCSQAEFKQSMLEGTPHGASNKWWNTQRSENFKTRWGYTFTQKQDRPEIPRNLSKSNGCDPHTLRNCSLTSVMFLGIFIGFSFKVFNH